MSLTSCSRVLELAEAPSNTGRTAAPAFRATMRPLFGAGRRAMPAVFVILAFTGIAAAVLALRAAAFVPGLWR